VRAPTGRLVAGLAAAALLVGAVALVARDDVVVEELTVDAPTGPDDPTTIALDVALYRPARLGTDDDPRPAVVLGHGFGSDRRAVDAWARRLAGDGRVVLTWSARGFGGSQGRVGLADPTRDAADVRALLDLLAERDEVRQDAPGDPRVALVGASYGGGLALLGASVDDRVDAVAAVATWADLASALAPDRADDGGPGVLAEQWASVLFAGAAGASLDLGAATGPDADAAAPGGGAAEPSGDAAADPDVGAQALLGRACGAFDPAVCLAYVASASAGTLLPEARTLLEARSVPPRAASITAPTLLVQGQQDTLFDLGQSLANARALQDAGTPVALRWVPGGHGEVGAGDPGDAVADAVDGWLDRWLPLRGDAPAGDEPDLLAWTDPVSGAPRSSDTLPGPGTTLLRATAGGRLVPGGADLPLPTQDDAAGGTRVVLRPPGALPASISTLPALGGIADLLPQLDLPGQSATWRSDPLDADLSLLGAPRLTLRVEAPAGVPGAGPPVTPDSGAPDAGPAAGTVPDVGALLFVKLRSTTPNGRSTLLQAAANPTRVDELPATVTLELAPLATRVQAGDRLELVVATTDLAHAVPRVPAAFSLDLSGDGAGLSLPVVPEQDVATVPPLLRVAVPVALALLLVAAAAWATRRHERRLADAPVAEGGEEVPVRIEGLVKRYADGKVAVAGLDLEVHRGQVVGLLGPNGAGKTTTMRILLGLITPTAGRVLLFGREVRPGHPVLARVGTLVEGPGFPPYLTGRQALRSHWELGGRPWQEADVEHALEVADLGPAIDRPVGAYSHGMRQRLAIAQALLARPELLVLDEPTDGLDPEQIRAMRQLLARLGEQGTTILVSSHLLAEVEQTCTHVAVVRSGRVVAAGPVGQVMGATRSVVVRVDDRERGRAVLAPLVGQDALDLESDGIAVVLGEREVADLVEALVAAGLRVHGVVPRGRLEDTFLALTGGEPAGGSAEWTPEERQ